jgi:hypothetical protein
MGLGPPTGGVGSSVALRLRPTRSSPPSNAAMSRFSLNASYNSTLSTLSTESEYASDADDGGSSTLEYSASSDLFSRRYRPLHGPRLNDIDQQSTVED